MAIPIIIPQTAPTGKISAFIATRMNTAANCSVIILATNDVKAGGLSFPALSTCGPQGIRRAGGDGLDSRGNKIALFNFENILQN